MTIVASESYWADYAALGKLIIKLILIKIVTQDATRNCVKVGTTPKKEIPLYFLVKATNCLLNA